MSEKLNFVIWIFLFQTKGLQALPRLVMFTSEDAHYSSGKLAAFMGHGSDNVYKVNTCSRGKMIIEHLESEIVRAKNEGALPFLVVATAGTTVLGAFDPINQIADVCQKYNMWLHVDAAWGGGALMSQKYRHLLNGIERLVLLTYFSSLLHRTKKKMRIKKVNAIQLTVQNCLGN